MAHVNTGILTSCGHREQTNTYILQTELMVEIYSKSLARAIGKVLLMRLPIKKSQFPVKRVAKIMVSRAAAFFFFFFGGRKILPNFGEKKLC